MSYFRQVLCYACREAVAVVTALGAPTAAEVVAWRLVGWDTAAWPSQGDNFERWQNFSNFKLFGEKGAPRLVRGWMLPGDARLTCAGCKASFGGTAPAFEYTGVGDSARVGGARSPAAYHLLAARGESLAGLCANLLACPG